MLIQYNRIQIFLEYVAQNITRSIPTAEAMAKELYMSRSTLFRSVDRELGMSPFQYIRQAKLEKAKELLISGKYNRFRDISEEVGYARADYFAMLFKEAYAIEPNDYLKTSTGS